MRTCPSCQHEIAEEALFCGYCGQRSEPPAAKRTMLGMPALTPDVLKARLASPDADGDESGRKATVLMASIKPEDIARATNSVEVNITPRRPARPAAADLEDESLFEVRQSRATTLPIQSPIYNVSVSLSAQKDNKATLLLSGASSPEITAGPTTPAIPISGGAAEDKDDAEPPSPDNLQLTAQEADLERVTLDMVPLPRPEKATLNLSSAPQDERDDAQEPPSLDAEPAEDEPGEASPPEAPLSDDDAQDEPALIDTAEALAVDADEPEEGASVIEPAQEAAASNAASRSAPAKATASLSELSSMTPSGLVEGAAQEANVERGTLVMSTVSSIDAGWDDLDGWPDPESFSIGDPPVSTSSASGDLPFADTIEGNRAEILRQIANSSDDPEPLPSQQPQPLDDPSSLDTEETRGDTFEASRQEMLADIAKAEEEMEAASTAPPTPDKPTPRPTVPAQQAAPDVGMMGKAPDTPKKAPASKRGQPTALIGRDDEAPQASKATLVIDDGDDLDGPRAPGRGFSVVKWGIIAATALLVFGAVSIGIAVALW